MEINFIKYLTLRRAFNIVKVISSFWLSKLFKRTIVWGMPISYSIEPTNNCNLKCPECPSGLGALTRPLGLLKTDLFKTLIDQISKDGFYVQLFFQGEPYINKNLPEMIKYAQSKNVYISISTNGHFVTEKNVEYIIENAPDKLIYSVDGLDEETYQNYRIGGSFAKVDKGLQLLVETKKRLNKRRPFIEFQFIVMKQNEHQINQVFEYCNQRGVDKVVMKTMQVSNYENALKFLPSVEKYRRYKLSDESIELKHSLKNHCFALWRTSVITWDGKVVPCCFDKDANFPLGQLNGKDFKEIWKGEEYNKFRRGVMLNRKGLDMCTNCTEGLKVNIMEIEN